MQIVNPAERYPHSIFFFYICILSRAEDKIQTDVSSNDADVAIEYCVW